MHLVTPIAHLVYIFAEYSPGTGNAMSSKIYQQAKVHEAMGGTTYVIASDRREHGYDHGTLVTYASMRRRDREWFTNAERRIDAGLGTLAGVRPLITRFHRDAIMAVPQDARALVIYNYAGVVGRNLRRDYSGKIVLHLGNEVFRSWRPSHIRRAIECSDLTVTVSDFLRDQIIARIGKSPENLHVLRNGVDSTVFSPAGQNADRPVTFLTAGDIVPGKGPHLLLQAAQVLAQRTRDFRVHIVGSAGNRPSGKLTEYEQSLRSMASALPDIVEFLPFTSRGDMPNVYRQADVFCMPVQINEGAGNVVLEAMATGLPVISARRGGIPEYLGPDGSYVEPQDVDEFAGAMYRFLVDNELRQGAGAALRRRAQELSWESNVIRLMDLLQ